MMGDKKLSAIRQELQRNIAAQGANPIASLDRRIRRLHKKANGKESRALTLLRGALSQVVAGKPQAHTPSSPRKSQVRAEKRPTRRRA